MDTNTLLWQSHNTGTGSAKRDAEQIVWSVCLVYVVLDTPVSTSTSSVFMNAVLSCLFALLL